ncbi:NAD-binding protein [Lentinula aciculospora]|uniref:NAD-binding protein n=1 Tax=Lentinula aciculospora TaxID=153920 RepID=A0A9W9DXX6_9AGAR|nr:NAD-binding protein [Lentinula aciculospora]
MSTKVPLLLTGATGYIGGTVLTRFLRRPDASSFDIRLLVRSNEKAKNIRDLNLGVTVFIGSHTDAGLMEELTSQVDIVIATADCDSIDAAQSTLRGLKKRFEMTGKPPIFIHTASTGVYADFVGGKHANSEVFDDSKPEQIETLPPTAPHRPVDLAIISGDAQGYLRSYIILPSTVWGTATGPLFDAKISNPHSVQIPYSARAALARGQGGMLTEGKNEWPIVEIHELGDLYSLLYDAIQSEHPMAGHGREGYYNAGHEDYSMRQLAKSISQALVELNRGTNLEPSPFTQEELDKFFGQFASFFGSNSRCLSTRSKAIGWSPQKGLGEMLASVQYEIEALIAKGL